MHPHHRSVCPHRRRCRRPQSAGQKERSKKEVEGFVRDEHPSAVGELARAAAEASSQGQRIADREMLALLAIADRGAGRR